MCNQGDEACAARERRHVHTQESGHVHTEVKDQVKREGAVCEQVEGDWYSSENQSIPMESALISSECGASAPG